MLVFFIVYKGAKGLDLDDTPIGEAFAWAFGLGIFFGLVAICTMVPFMRKEVDKKFNEDGSRKVVVSTRGLFANFPLGHWRPKTIHFACLPLNG